MDQTAIIKLVLGIGFAIAVHVTIERLTMFFQRLIPAFKLERWLYEPIAREDLPPKHARYFERETPAYLEHGFRPIGDFVVRRTPKLSTARCFLSEDGTILGNIEVYCGAETLACVTMCADGTYIETSSSQGAPQVSPEFPMVLISADPPTISGVIEEHRRQVATWCATHLTEPLPMADDDFKEVLLYGQRLVARQAHAEGYLPVLPDYAREAPATGT